MTTTTLTAADLLAICEAARQATLDACGAAPGTDDYGEVAEDLAQAADRLRRVPALTIETAAQHFRAGVRVYQAARLCHIAGRVELTLAARTAHDRLADAASAYYFGVQEAFPGLDWFDVIHQGGTGR